MKRRRDKRVSWGETGRGSASLTGGQEPRPLLSPRVRAPFLRSHGLGSGLASVTAEEGWEGRQVERRLVASSPCSCISADGNARPRAGWGPCGYLHGWSVMAGLWSVTHLKATSLWCLLHVHVRGEVQIASAPLREGHTLELFLGVANLKIKGHSER